MRILGQVEVWSALSHMCVDDIPSTSQRWRNKVLIWYTIMKKIQARLLRWIARFMGQREVDTSAGERDTFHPKLRVYKRVGTIFLSRNLPFKCDMIEEVLLLASDILSALKNTRNLCQIGKNIKVAWTVRLPVRLKNSAGASNTHAESIVGPACALSAYRSPSGASRHISPAFSSPVKTQYIRMDLNLTSCQRWRGFRCSGKMLET
jgi:hypothetical protein